MGSSQTRDVIVGLFVSAALVVISYLSFSLGGARFATADEMTIYAIFDEVGGLTPRSPVVVAGVKIGTVQSIDLDENFRAVVSLRLRSGVKLPADTTAAILTAGVLGNQYVGLVPGIDPEPLAAGATLDNNESAVILERLIGRVIQNLGAE